MSFHPMQMLLTECISSAFHLHFFQILTCSFAEGAIAFFFVLFAVLLFTRDPKFVTGWSVFFKKG